MSKGCGCYRLPSGDRLLCSPRARAALFQTAAEALQDSPMKLLNGFPVPARWLVLAVRAQNPHADEPELERLVVAKAAELLEAHQRR